MFPGTGDKGTALVMPQEAAAGIRVRGVGRRPNVGAIRRQGPGQVDGDAPPAGEPPKAVVRTEGPEEIGAATQRRLLGAFPISALQLRDDPRFLSYPIGMVHECAMTNYSRTRCSRASMTRNVRPSPRAPYRSRSLPGPARARRASS